MEPQVVVNPPTDQPDENGWYPDHTRRVVVLWIDEEQVLESMMMVLTDQCPQYLLKLKENKIPQDSKVLRVTHSWDRRAFGFLLSHPSFPPTPNGGIPPDLTSNHQWEWVLKEPAKS